MGYLLFLSILFAGIYFLSLRLLRPGSKSNKKEVKKITGGSKGNSIAGDSKANFKKKIGISADAFFSSYSTFFLGIAVFFLSVFLDGKIWSLWGISPTMLLSGFMICVFIEEKTHKFLEIVTDFLIPACAMFLIGIAILIFSAGIYYSKKPNFFQAVSLVFLIILFHAVLYRAAYRGEIYIQQKLAEFKLMTFKAKISLFAKKACKYTAELTPFLTIIYKLATKGESILKLLAKLSR